MYISSSLRPRKSAQSQSPGRTGRGLLGVRHIAFKVDSVDAKLHQMGGEAHVTLGPLDFDDFIPGLAHGLVGGSGRERRGNKSGRHGSGQSARSGSGRIRKEVMMQNTISSTFSDTVAGYVSRFDEKADAFVIATTPGFLRKAEIQHVRPGGPETWKSRTRTARSR